MTIKDLIDKTKQMPGNLARSKGIYISPENADFFAQNLGEADGMQGILVTPYLIITEGALYELHYYELDIEVRDEESHFIDYSPGNLLPEEVVENIFPQAIVALGDIDFYQKAISRYLEGMRKMTFHEILTHYPELRDARMFYQMFA